MINVRTLVGGTQTDKRKSGAHFLVCSACPRRDELIHDNRSNETLLQKHSHRWKHENAVMSAVSSTKIKNLTESFFSNKSYKRIDFWCKIWWLCLCRKTRSKINGYWWWKVFQDALQVNNAYNINEGEMWLSTLSTLLSFYNSIAR